VIIIQQEDKTHPADWANPGRVKVLLKKDGKVLHGKYPNSPSLSPPSYFYARPQHVQTQNTSSSSLSVPPSKTPKPCV